MATPRACYGGMRRQRLRSNIMRTTFKMIANIPSQSSNHVLIARLQSLEAYSCVCKLFAHSQQQRTCLIN